MPEMVALEKALCRSAPWRYWTRKGVLPWALQDASPRGHGLEIGGGSGLMAAELLRRFPDLRLTVTDFDASMLDGAHDLLRPFGDRAQLATADATELQYADGTFDYVFSFIMLHHVVRWEAALTEALRVLKPGGWIVGYDILDTFLFRLFHKLERADVRLLTLSEIQSFLDPAPADRALLIPGSTRSTVRFKIRKTH